MPSSTKPSPIALVVCDNVYRESGGKQALVGLFNRVNAPKLPVAVPKMCIYIAVTDIRPNTILKVDIVNGETDEPVIEMEGPAPPKVDPTTIVDMVFQIQGATFKDRGLYFVRLFGNGIPLLQRPFHVETTQTE